MNDQIKVLSLKNAFLFGYEHTKKNFPFLVKASATVIFITFIINGLQKMASESSVFLGALFFALTFALDLIINIGYTKVYLKMVDNESVQIRDIFSHHGYFSTYCVAYVILSVLTLAGILLLVIPGLFVIAAFLFVPFLIIDKNMGVQEAFKKSYDITKGYRMFILLYIAIVFLLNLAGLAALGIGLLFTVPITYFSTVYLYRTLLK